MTPIPVDEAIVVAFDAIGTSFKLKVEFWNAGSYLGADTLSIAKSTVGTNPSGWRGAWKAAVTSYCSTNNLADPSAGSKWIAFDGEPLSITAQAHINPATNNLPTNFTALSALLGLANGLNDANTAQNDMATKFNSLLTHLETVGIQIP